MRGVLAGGRSAPSQRYDIGAAVLAPTASMPNDGSPASFHHVDGSTPAGSAALTMLKTVADGNTFADEEAEDYMQLP